MKITILGAGAMGSWFGGKLAAQGQEVTLITTNRAHRDAVNKSGLMLKSGAVEQIVEVNVTNAAGYSGPADLVILFTKSFQSESALSSIATTFDDNTYVLSLQNGLGNIETISRFVSIEQVLIGVTMMPVDRVAPGIVESTGHGASCR